MYNVIRDGIYDGARLLSMRDKNGEKPEIYVCTTNRSSGKSTWWSKYFVNRFLRHKELFCLVYRYRNELDAVEKKFFRNANLLFFPNMTMRSETRAAGLYNALYLDDKPCGFAVAINSASKLRTIGGELSECSSMFFDEFQDEAGRYCTDEVSKLISIHTTIARAPGKQVKYVPLIMCSNTCSLLNPYFIAWGITTQLRKDTKYLRGEGFVVEQQYYEGVAEMQKQSAFNRAFASSEYLAYANQNVYLDDNRAFIEKPKGQSRYLATIKYCGKEYALREYPQDGVIYVDRSIDKDYQYKLVVSSDDHDKNYVMLRNHALFITNMRFYFDNGAFRFKDLDCKAALINMLSL